MKDKYALVIAGTQSGCGKTTISLALMAALKQRGFAVQPFKVGPDFIDPGLHTQITQVESRNLDGWMLSARYNQELFRGLLGRADLAIVEGVMGLFDGHDGVSESGSTAEMAKWLKLPVVLVVDARSMARSAAALVYGFSRFDPKLHIAGVIFNRLGGPEHLQYLKEAMAASLPEIAVLGGIPREDAIRIPERHLGLVTAQEMDMNQPWRESLIRLVDDFVDVEQLLQKTVIAPPLAAAAPASAPDSHGVRPPTVAVARDAAFCFYYPDNLELLQRAGARLQFFSPLQGESLPPESAGVYLGGGYPELFADQLSRQRRFLEDLQCAAALGLPIYAECGGLMVLSRSIVTTDGDRYPMAGILPFATRMLKKRKALGYTEVVLQQPCLLGEPGLRLRGHEFHYSEIIEAVEDSRLSYAYRLQSRNNTAARMEGYVLGSVLASYIHLHWGSAPQAAAALLQRCGATLEKRREAGTGCYESQS